MPWDVTIIGAGASGLICAIEAAKRGRKVLLLDHNTKICSKVRISGGGRCNFTNINLSSENYISNNRHFCKSAISGFTPENIISLLNRHKIAFHQKEEGKLFLNTSSAEIIRMLKSEAEAAGAEFMIGTKVRHVKKNGMFKVITDKGTFDSSSLVIATGGLSYPDLGASDFGIRTAEKFGINVVAPRPGLVPLIFASDEHKMYKDLSGVSFNARVSTRGIFFDGNILFTHRGLSGPAILQISSYWQREDIITIDLLPSIDIMNVFINNRKSRQMIHNLLSQYLPSRFTQIWCSSHTGTKPLCQFSDRELERTAMEIHNWKIRPSGTEGYAKAEVTVGGIDTNEISSKTMESKKVAGLYFIGEVLDVTGQLGGYNLHWAWASGHAAGQYV